MRLPWVSRARCREAEDAAFQHLHLFQAEQRRFDALLEKYHALKLQGATIPEPIVTRSAKEVDPLTQAVLNASAGKPPQVRAMMMKQLNEDRKSVEAGLMDESDIFRRIDSGFTPDDGIPE